MTLRGAVVDAALKIHVELGPGLLESVYETVLARMLERRGFVVECKKPINFGVPTLKEGLHRIVNKLDPSASPCLRVNR